MARKLVAPATHRVVRQTTAFAPLMRCFRSDPFILPGQNLAGVLLDALMGDYDSLEYTTETATATLATLALLSSDEDALGESSQVTQSVQPLSGASGVTYRAYEHNLGASPRNEEAIATFEQNLGMES